MALPNVSQIREDLLSDTLYEKHNSFVAIHQRVDEPAVLARIEQCRRQLPIPELSDRANELVAIACGELLGCRRRARHREGREIPLMVER